MSSIIRVRNLTRSFGEINAVQQLDFTVKKNEVYGFLGQNGAGKSTTIRMLLTLVKPSAGEIEIFGLNLFKHRKEILQKTGAIIEKPDLYKYLTALENLEIFAALSGLKPTRKQLMLQLEKVDLAERADSKIKTYSQGMKQRLGIAVALVHDPDLLILDEPLNGLDPQGIADIRFLVRHLSKDLGKTIFISSHLLSEMEQVADTLMIIHKGKKIAEGSLHDLIHPEKQQLEIETDDADRLAEMVKEITGASVIKKLQQDKLLVKIRKEDIPVLLREAGRLNIGIYAARPRHSLEDYFLTLTAE
jgi:ABC-type multidrug transport system ATPase subunit